MKGIARLKGLLSRQNSDNRLDELFRRLVELGLEKWDPERRKVRRDKRISGQTRESPPTSAVKVENGGKETGRRSIPASVRDEIWKRDEGRCRYHDPITGRRCGGVHKVQIDHIIPVAKGGTDVPSNLRLLCRRHNLLSARQIFGDRLIDSKINWRMAGNRVIHKRR